MKLDKMTDEAIAMELARQREVQKENPPESEIWIMAARIIHNLASEQHHRRRGPEVGTDSSGDTTVSLSDRWRSFMRRQRRWLRRRRLRQTIYTFLPNPNARCAVRQYGPRPR